MDAKNLIALTGFMGSGKSRIGRELAGRLGFPFFDLDEVIEREEQQQIPDIFRSKGEEYFRMLERLHLRNLLEHRPAVLALGGGANQQEEIRDLLQQNAVTIYLQVPIDTLVVRLQKDKKRPLLRDASGKLLDGDQLRDRIAGLLEKREPLYRKADITVPVQPLWSKHQTTSELIRLLDNHAPNALP